jgi:hypothetical protein
MPWIIDYTLVTDHLTRLGLKCNYYNSGAFGFADPAGAKHVAWIGPEDTTIRPAARPFVRQIAPPYEPTLATLATGAWQSHFPGRVWAMPMSHWAYELDYGSRDWMPALIEHVGVDPGLLQNRNNAAAIEFGPHEARQFTHFAQRLLEMLLSSDFMLAFLGPPTPVLCTLHHHKQLWWTSKDDAVLAALDGMATAPVSDPP